MCRSCKGNGFSDREAIEKLHVPKGVNTGTVLRIKGVGNQFNKVKAGDVCIEITVKSHEMYKRVGCDIITTEKITLT